MDLPADGTYYCGSYLPLTQRNAFADEQDTATAWQLGMTLQDYRAAYPDQPR